MTNDDKQECKNVLTGLHYMSDEDLEAPTNADNYRAVELLYRLRAQLGELIDSGDVDALNIKQGPLRVLTTCARLETLTQKVKDDAETEDLAEKVSDDLLAAVRETL